MCTGVLFFKNSILCTQLNYFCDTIQPCKPEEREKYLKKSRTRTRLDVDTWTRMALVKNVTRNSMVALTELQTPSSEGTTMSVTLIRTCQE